MITFKQNINHSYQSDFKSSLSKCSTKRHLYHSSLLGYPNLHKTIVKASKQAVVARRTRSVIIVLSVLQQQQHVYQAIHEQHSSQHSPIHICQLNCPCTEYYLLLLKLQVRILFQYFSKTRCFSLLALVESIFKQVETAVAVIRDDKS